VLSIPVFLSSPQPFQQVQEDFLNHVEGQLELHGLEPRTLGRSQYDMDAPLEGIRRMMAGSCGLIALAFRRTWIEAGVDRPSSDMGLRSSNRDKTWLTSPYVHIEPAMAFQLGLPLLIWREEGVLADGVLDRGAIGCSMPEFDLAKSAPALDQDEWQEPFREWIRRVRTVYHRRGTPPRLWD
jgi:hypothetical protein